MNIIKCFPSVPTHFSQALGLGEEGGGPGSLQTHNITPCIPLLLESAPTKKQHLDPAGAKPQNFLSIN